MHTKTTRDLSSSPLARVTAATALAVSLAFLSACSAGSGPRPDQSIAGEGFRTPEAAADAVVAAAQAQDKARLLAIFGPDSEGLLSSGDEVADQAAREKFLAKAKEKRTIVKDGEDYATLEVGSDDWPFPIPLVKTKGGWQFDTEAGRDELVSRRVGRNEIGAINASLAYVDAQRDYAAREKKARGRAEYAQRIRSTPGRHDGLYWDVREGEKPSPLGPLFAEAAGEGYHLEQAGDEPRPFHGYYFRVLTAQGAKAPGGAKSYVHAGHMTGGFALVAWPAEYGQGGVMTFVVNQLGVVFQKDLGEKTAEAAAAIKAYDPDDSWDPVEPVAAPVDEAED